MPVSPLQYAEKLIDRAEQLTRSVIDPPQADSMEADLLRAAWTFNAASIDTYFHQRLRSELLDQPLSKRAAKFLINLGDVDALIDNFIAKRNTSRPRVMLRNIIDQKLLTMTFQGSRNIEDAFSFIGASNYWTSISTELRMTPTEIKTRLNKQYDRRNRIAHEGDFQREQRPRTMKFTPIAIAEVNQEFCSPLA